MTAARTALERSRIFLDALQSKINALGTEFVNIDDPAHRAQVEQDRQRLIAEHERVKTEITQQTKAIADIQEEARKASVPPGWLR
jgi:vacuolar-type H+-ATPase subunit D/Vma8